jgi:uncharacterized protein YceK
MLKLDSAKAAFATIGAALVLSGCASVGSYTPPSSLTGDDAKNEVVVDKPFDATWASLIDYASSTFFAIDNFEKASGLITLSFGSSDPGRFIDCGQIVSQSGNFNGPYTTYMATQLRATLTGKMNLVVRQVDPNRTLVRANARYIFVAPPQAQVSGESWTFESGGQATVTVANPVSGTIPTRTCRPTYAAEKAILDAVKK